MNGGMEDHAADCEQCGGFGFVTAVVDYPLDNGMTRTRYTAWTCPSDPRTHESPPAASPK